MNYELTQNQLRFIHYLEDIGHKVIYLAGPIRSSEGQWGMHRNIERAKIIARILWKHNFCVICPQANTAFFDGPDIYDETFLQNDFYLVERSDLVVVAPGWKTSEGTKGEIEFAEQCGTPVDYWPDGVPQEIID